MSGNQLPPFPVDAATLDMLMAAIDPRGHGDLEAEHSGVGHFLDVMSQLGGSDTDAIEEIVDEGDALLPGLAGVPIHIMRDPQYHEHDVMAALIDEIRRLRATASGR